ncbi:MAG: signal peptidase II [Actinobacteria bacterium]|nr:signal peptidase II [Actinomycetota bacterium]
MTEVSAARLRRRALLYASALVGADQLVKIVAVHQLQNSSGVAVFGNWLSFVLARNSGAAFSFGAGGSTWIFTTLAVAVVVGTVWFFPRIRDSHAQAAATLLIGGASGNLLDRLFRSPGVGIGHVVDYIKVQDFPIFNIADMCITAAAVLFVFTSLRPNPRTGASDER